MKYAFDIGLHQDIPICSRLCVMLDMTKVYHLISVWVTWTVTAGSRITRKRELVQSFCLKGYEATEMLRIVDYVREMTAKKACKCCRYVSFEHVLILFWVYSGHTGVTVSDIPVNETLVILHLSFALTTEDADSAINTKEIISSIVSAANKKLKLRQQNKSTDSLDFDTTLSQYSTDTITSTTATSTTTNSQRTIEIVDGNFQERSVDAAIARASGLVKSQTSLNPRRYSIRVMWVWHGKWDRL